MPPVPFFLRLVWLALIVAASLEAAQAQLQVASSGAVESRPVVAHNSKNGGFLVAYVSDSNGTPELRARRFDANGQVQGAELTPLLGYEAIDRPVAAYSPESDVFFVAVHVRAGDSVDIKGAILDAAGTTLLGVGLLFFDTSRYYPGNTGDGPGALQITYNSILDEFVVTFQRTYWTQNCQPLPVESPCNNQVWGWRVELQAATSPFPVLLADFGVSGFHGHAIEFVPIADLSLPQFSGGRYFFSAGTRGLKMLGTDLQPYPTLWSQGAPSFPLVPLNYGAPEGSYDDLDIAYGQLNGQHRLLVVWSDADNCRPSLTACPGAIDQWTGIWGTFVDPFRLRYDETSGAQDNTPFPISRIWSHLGNTHLSTPRVTYDGTSDSFVVAWREIPFQHPSNDESRSHIRAGVVDEHVPDGLYGTSQVPLPHANQVLSPVSGNCAAGLPCYSAEDPRLPDVAASPGASAAGSARPLIVWQQKGTASPNDLDIQGSFLACAGIFCDGFESGSTNGWSVTVP